MMQSTNTKTPGVESARRALRILLFFGDSQRELTADDIAQEIGISVPSVYRFLALLKELHLVENTAENRYYLTPRTLIFAEGSERTLDTTTLLKPLIQELAATLGEAALITQRIGDYATCVEISHTNHMVAISVQPGEVLSLHRGAGSKVLLASMTDAWLQGYCARMLDTMPDEDTNHLLQELQQVQQRGWAISSAEIDEGVWACAAPVTAQGRTVAALSVAAPSYRIQPTERQAIIDAVVAQAAKASSAITHRIYRKNH